MYNGFSAVLKIREGSNPFVIKDSDLRNAFREILSLVPIRFIRLLSNKSLASGQEERGSSQFSVSTRGHMITLCLQCDRVTQRVCPISGRMTNTRIARLSSE